MTFLNRRLFDNVSVFVDSLSGANRVAFDVAKPNGVLTLGISGNVSANNIKIGTGSPEGSVDGIKGDIYQRTDGSIGTTLYIKETGSGNTGWSALGAPSSGSLSGGISGYSAFWSSSNSISASNSIIDSSALLIVPQNQKDVFIGNNSKFHAATGVFTIGTTASTINDALEVNGTTRSKRFYSSISSAGLPTPQLYLDNTNSTSALEVRAMGNTNGGVTDWEQSIILEASTGGASGGLVFSAYTGDIKFQTNARQTAMNLKESGNLILGGDTTDDKGHKFQVNGTTLSASARPLNQNFDSLIIRDGSLANDGHERLTGSRILYESTDFQDPGNVGPWRAAIGFEIEDPGVFTTSRLTLYTQNDWEEPLIPGIAVVGGESGDNGHVYVKTLEALPGNHGETVQVSGAIVTSEEICSRQALIASGNNPVTQLKYIAGDDYFVEDLRAEFGFAHSTFGGLMPMSGARIMTYTDAPIIIKTNFGGTPAGNSAIFNTTGNLLLKTAIDNNADTLQVSGSAGISGNLTSFNIKRGTGSPEGVVTGVVGDIYQRTNGSTGTTIYVKESGTGNTGWTAVSAGSTGGSSLSGGVAQRAAIWSSSTSLSASSLITETPGGNVLINSSTDYGTGYKLQINGDTMVTATTGAKIGWNNAGNYFNWIESGGIANNNYMRFACGNTEVMRLRNSSGGGGTYALIGTTSDVTGKLQVGGDVYSTGVFVTDVAGDAVILRNSGSNNNIVSSVNLNLHADKWNQYSAAFSNITFSTNGTEKARVSDNGNVLIGTTTDNSSGVLQVAGAGYFGGRLRIAPGGTSVVSEAVRISSGLGAVNAGTSIDWWHTTGAANLAAYARIAGVTDSGGSGGVLAFYTTPTFGTASSERMRVSETGNLIIASTSDAGNYKLQVTGQSYFTGAINVGTQNTTANSGINIYGAGQGGNRVTVNLASSGSPVVNAGLLTGYDYQVTGAMNATQCGFRWSHAPNSFSTNLQAYVYSGGANVFDAQQWTPTNVLIRVNDVDKVNVTSSALSANVNINSSNIQRGSGSPEGSVVGNVGDIYQRTDGSAGITLYIKESGTGNTGWTAVAPGSSGGSSLSGGIANRLAVWSGTSSISASSVISVGSSAVLIGTTTDNLSGTLQVVGDVHAAGVLRLNPGNVSGGIVEAIRITSNPGGVNDGRSIDWREQDTGQIIARIAGRRDQAGAGSGIALFTALNVGTPPREIARFTRYGGLSIGTTGDDNGTDLLRVIGSAGISGNMVANNWKRGTGSPEGTISGTVGDVYQRIDGGTGSTLYVKENQPSATTGWTALSSPSTGLVNGNGSGVRDRLAVWSGTTTMSAANIVELYTAPVAGGPESGLKIFNDNTRTSSAIWKTGPDFAHKWSNSSNTAIVTFTTGGRVLIGSGATDIGGASNLLQVAGNIMTTSTNGSISVGTASASSQGNMIVYGGNAAGTGHYRKYDSGLGGSVIDTPIISGYDINLDGAGNFTRCGLRWSHETGSYTTQLKLYTNSTTNASSLVDSMILTPLRQSILANNVVRFNVDQTAISGNITFYAGGGTAGNLTTSAMTVKNQSLVVFRDSSEATTNAGYMGMNSNNSFKVGIASSDVITINSSAGASLDKVQVTGSVGISGSLNTRSVATDRIFLTGGNTESYTASISTSGQIFYDTLQKSIRAGIEPSSNGEVGMNYVPVVKCTNLGRRIINNNNARWTLNTCNDALSGSGTGYGMLGFPFIPYDFWRPGKKIRVVSEGCIQNTGTPTMRLRLSASGSPDDDTYMLMDTGAITMSTITGVRDYTATYTLCCRSVNSTGADLYVSGRFNYGVTSNTIASVNVGVGNLVTCPNTLGVFFLNLSAQFSAASTSNGITANFYEMTQLA